MSWKEKKRYFSRVSEGNMSFLFCAPKEKNEVKEKDENFFMVSEGKDEKSF